MVMRDEARRPPGCPYLRGLLRSLFVFCFERDPHALCLWPFQKDKMLRVYQLEREQPNKLKNALTLRALFGLPYSADESFEVRSFREPQRRRMVPGLAEEADDLRISTRVKSRISDNLLEEERRHKPGAGKSEKESSLPEQLESEEVDVLVSAARPF